MWELDCKESWAPNNWCFWIVVLEKAFESSLDFKDTQPVNPKGNQSWIFIGKTDAEAPILWPPDAKNWPDSLEKTLIMGKIEVEGEADDREWEGWMALPTRWIWVWVSFGSWWWTGRPGMLQSMGSQILGHDWVTELRIITWGLWSFSVCIWRPPYYMYCVMVCSTWTIQQPRYPYL